MVRYCLCSKFLSQVAPVFIIQRIEHVFQLRCIRKMPFLYIHSRVEKRKCFSLDLEESGSKVTQSMQQQDV